MADTLMAIEFDTRGFLDLLARVPKSIEARFNKEGRITADRVAAEARRRVAIATGLTHAGIDVEPLEKGSGWAVVSARNPFPNVPIWLESGTVHMEAQPYFDVSVRLEEGPHFRRLAEALQEELDGLG